MERGEFFFCFSPNEIKKRGLGGDGGRMRFFLRARLWGEGGQGTGGSRGEAFFLTLLPLFEQNNDPYQGFSLIKTFILLNKSIS